MAAHRTQVLRPAILGLLIFLILFGLMAKFTCPGQGCAEQFKSGAALSAHKRACKDKIALTAKIVLDKQRKKREMENMQIRAEHGEVREAWDARDDLDRMGQGFELRPEPEPQATPPQEYRPSGLPRRRTRMPARFRDDLPPLPPQAAQIDDEPQIQRHGTPIDPPQESTAAQYQTEINNYGIYHVYPGGPPSYTPDELHTLQHVADSSNFDPKTASTAVRPWWSSFGSLSTIEQKFFTPFLNATVFRLMNWFYNGTNQKSLADINRLVNDVLLAPDFNVDDLHGFNAVREAKRLDEWENEPRTSFSVQDGWIETPIKISVPSENVKHASEATAPQYSVPKLFYRRLLEVIKAAFNEPATEHFHLSPFECWWKPAPDSEPQRFYSELYTGDAYIKEHEKIRSQVRSDGCRLETVVAAIMLWSDSTHLTSFGNASLWPIYLFLGNQSKYMRGKPSAFAAHHLAYLPKLDDEFQDWYRTKFGKTATAEVLKHCRRELMQAIWLLLLDDDFMHAYHDGIIMEFPDGIKRRVFPRFFTYSADYPEKILLACIKFLSRYPCPRCLVEKSKISTLGTPRDRKERTKNERVDDKKNQDQIKRVRKWIYEKGRSLTSVYIDRVLGHQSLIPTRSAFSVRLSSSGFNFYQMFVPDLLHEFELGVWKGTFTHLMRILYANGGDLIQTLNERYRQVPTFGCDTIRKFHRNASGMKKLAARDFEDLLQCALPVFEDLLPEPHNTIVMDLLFELATWHGLAKLRLHTEATLNELDNSTTRLGKLLRRFSSTTCETYDTRELPAEEAARGRRKAALTSRAKGKQKSQASADEPSSKFKRFNINTYKTHALGAYVKAIRLYGTTDNYTTQTGELEHRRVKRFYPRAHKGQIAQSIGRQQRRERILHKMAQLQQNGGTPARTGKRKRGQATSTKPPTVGNPVVRFDEQEPLPYSTPDAHHHISTDVRHKVDLPEWLGANEDDPALEDFLPRLKNHLLGRILNLDYDGDETEFTSAERNALIFVNNRIYRHKVLRVNYTTYDLRREQDSLNPRTRADVMLLSREEAHPYWYARVIAIFHAVVQFKGLPSYPTVDPGVRQIEFLWVRWFGQDPPHQSGWRAKRLHRIGFINSEEPSAFGFLDPMLVVRGVHLIPAFAFGHTQDLLPESLARLASEHDEDWMYYYVDMFVDRDMVMRFRGGGVGHTAVRDASNKFLGDRDSLDLMGYQTQDTDSEEELEVERDVPDGDGNGRGVGSEGEEPTGPDADAGEDVNDGVGEDEEDFGYTDLEIQDVDDNWDGGEPEDNSSGSEGSNDDALGAEDGEGGDNEAWILGFAEI